jgi:hypothetical protein
MYSPRTEESTLCYLAWIQNCVLGRFFLIKIMFLKNLNFLILDMRLNCNLSEIKL